MSIVVDLKIQPPRVQFTPGYYKNARRQFARGDQAPLIQMMEVATEDTFISGLLGARVSGFKRDWSLQVTGDSIDTDRLQWLENILDDAMVYDLLEVLHEADQKGYVVVDFDWEIQDLHQVPVKFHRYGQHHFAYDDDGVLMIKEGAKLRPILEDASQFAIIAETTRTKPYLLPIIRAHILMDFGVEAWAAFIEAWGEPMIVGKYPQGADADTRKKMDDAIQLIARSSRGTMPQGAEIEIKEAGRSTGDHKSFREDAKQDASIAILGHANAVQQSTGTQIGENTSAQQVRHDLKVSDMRALEPRVQLLVDEIWRRNFGGQPPRFRFDKSDPVNVDEELKKIDLAHRHGVSLSISNYQKLGLDVDETQEWIQKNTSSSTFLD